MIEQRTLPRSVVEPPKAHSLDALMRSFTSQGKRPGPTDTDRKIISLVGERNFLLSGPTILEWDEVSESDPSNPFHLTKFSTAQSE